MKMNNSIVNSSLIHCKIIFYILKPSLFISMALFSIFCYAQDKKFEKVCKLNSVVEYDKFINKYPSSKYLEEAIFRKSQIINTEKSLDGYLRIYPNGKYSRTVDSLVCLLKISNIGSISDINLLRILLSKCLFCKNCHDVVQKRIIDLEFQNANEINKLENYNLFLKLYPSTEYTTNIKNSIYKLEYAKVIKSNFLDSLNAFLEHYPSGAYSDSVKRRVEEIEFHLTKKKNSLAKYKSYNQKYPDGVHREEVNISIEELQKKAITQSNFNKSKIIKTLMEGDWFAKMNAAVALGKTKNPLAVEPLIRTLNDHGYGESYSMVRPYVAKALGEIGDSLAVDALLVVLETPMDPAGSEAAIALGKLNSKRSVDLLIKSLKDNILVNPAAEALGNLHARNAIKPLIAALNQFCHSDGDIANAIAKIGDTSAIPNLVYVLPNWNNGPQILTSLYTLGWKPESISDTIHVCVAKKNWYQLNKFWKEAKEILISDLYSKRECVVENSVNCLLTLGKIEMVPILIDFLNVDGSKEIAEIFLNCGNTKLSTAAKAWASDYGYSIDFTSGYRDIRWGVH